jgi:hypothetical protein
MTKQSGTGGMKRDRPNAGAAVVAVFTLPQAVINSPVIYTRKTGIFLRFRHPDQVYPRKEDIERK